MLSHTERDRLDKQTQKLVFNMTHNNETNYKYGKKSIAQYVKVKQFIRKYNVAMKEFIDPE